MMVDIGLRFLGIVVDWIRAPSPSVYYMFSILFDSLLCAVLAAFSLPWGSAWHGRKSEHRYASYAKRCRDASRQAAFLRKKFVAPAQSQMPRCGLDDPHAEALLRSLGGRSASAWIWPGTRACNDAANDSFITCETASAQAVSGQSQPPRVS